MYWNGRTTAAMRENRRREAETEQTRNKKREKKVKKMRNQISHN